MSVPESRRAPTALRVAAVLVVLQGAGLVVLAVIGLLDVVSSRVEVGVSVSVFFAAYGGALIACGWALWHVRGWARGPVLLTQLIQLGIAWNARDNVALAAVLAVVALTTLVAVLQPQSIRALLGDPEDQTSTG
jgi:hypothetical protein